MRDTFHIRKQIVDKKTEEIYAIYTNLVEAPKTYKIFSVGSKWVTFGENGRKGHKVSIQNLRMKGYSEIGNYCIPIYTTCPHIKDLFTKLVEVRKRLLRDDKITLSVKVHENRMVVVIISLYDDGIPFYNTGIPVSEVMATLEKASSDITNIICEYAPI